MSLSALISIEGWQQFLLTPSVCILRSSSMTKARTFRRRTLTHAELEDYLTDIGQGMEVNPRGYREVAMSECDSTLYTSKAVKCRTSYSPASTDEERVRNFCRVRKAATSHLRSCFCLSCWIKTRTIFLLPNFLYSLIAVDGAAEGHHTSERGLRHIENSHGEH